MTTTSMVTGAGKKLLSNHERLHVGLMLALTFSTGVVNAVGYLGPDKVFAGNMTGNVVILGMALAGAAGLPWVGPLLALFEFMLGAAIGGRVLRPVKTGWTGHTTVAIGVVGYVMAGLAVAIFFLGSNCPNRGSSSSRCS